MDGRNEGTTASKHGAGLAPRRVRLVVFVVMALIGLAAIVLIDRRAMIRMDEIGAGYTAPPRAVQP